MTGKNFSHIEAVLFDLDGTLLDTARDFAAILNQMRDQHSLPALPFESVRSTVSHGARALVTLAFDLQEGETGFETLRLELLERYGQHLAVHACLFEGLDGVLQHLEVENIPWGIVTNKPRIYSEAILSALALDQRCQSLVCADDVSRSKPDPESLLLACQQLQRQPGNVIYIGDHHRDIEAGKRANMITIAAAYGYIHSDDPVENWAADHCVENAEALLSLLRS